MTPRTLDRYVFRRTATALAVVLGLSVVLVVGLDLLLKINLYLKGPLAPDESRAALITEFVLLQIPAFLSPLTPVAMAAAALIALGPMLKRGETIALAASGVGLRRTARAILVLALLLGGADFALRDQLASRLEPRRVLLESHLMGTQRSSRQWLVDATGTAWSADRVVFEAVDVPHAYDVLAADPAGRLVHAGGLAWDGKAWRLEGPVLVVDPTAATPVVHASLDCTGSLDLKASPKRLARVLVSRNALTAKNLIQRGGRQNLNLALQRLLHAFAPLLSVLVAIPLFLRPEHSDRVMLAATRSLILALIPTLLLLFGSWASDASSWPPIVVAALTLAWAATPGTWWYVRWRM